MAVEVFVPRNFKRESLELIEQANVIIAEYQDAGFMLTLRQLYYQFVARDAFPDDRRWRQVGNDKWVRDLNGTPNATPNYKWLGAVVSDARLAGLIDWEMIEDRTRNVRDYQTFGSADEAVTHAAKYYLEDLWDSQPTRIEVWIEKDALIGVIEPACNRWRVPHFACRGNVSQSSIYAAGKRFADIYAKGQEPVVLHLGDHDPSGVDMTRDNTDRLAMFAGMHVTVERLALNMDQVRLYRPPPNPAKESDSRAADYIAKFGPSSWELDALDPKVIDGLIEAAIGNYIDQYNWDRDLKTETANRNDMKAAAARWTEVKKMVGKKK